MLRIILTLLLITLCAPATAQDISRELQQLSAVNRINPLQNPEFSRSEDIFDRRVLDRKSKVVGEVKDILVHKNGSLESMAVDFDRLRLGATVFLNFRQTSIRPLDDAYELAMDANELREFYPSLLANMATASGTEDDVYSTKRLKGIDVRKASGRKIGEIEDILFSANGARVSALFVEITKGTQRGETIAIPFRSTEFKEQSGRLYAEVSDTLAEAVLTLADD
ncbi:MAG: PRC-barrel domain-containing protein [Alphaproteobacteria bacterium]